ncbi:MAG: acyl-CoA dehydrogenase [Xanthobacteraceae bacterium]
MTYTTPVNDILFVLNHVAGLEAARSEGLYGDLGDDLVAAIVEEAGKFANEVVAPLNRVGDTHGTVFKDGAVTMPPGWKDVYRDWAAAGWNGLSASTDWGGQGLPYALNAALIEVWSGASMAFGLGPLLTMSAVELIEAHATPELKATYLPKLVSGEWMGTMHLTEPQAGSDVGALRTKAVRAEDGTYRLTGEKIFITFGEHDLTENIIHVVLARLPEAPPGTKGLSVFLVPKFLVNADGSRGARNDVKAQSIEHKLGIHASPTCTMVFGDEGGAVGYLVGEENNGIACMFTMMNRARLAIGLEGVAIAETATQHALAYACERRQGFLVGKHSHEPAPIVAHPDVKRMLLTMRALTNASRAICYSTAVAIDRARKAPDPAARRAADQRASLLTPVAKAFSTDIGTEVASIGIQVHGGMGVIEETGVAQFYRDVRVTQIYEGTNGIQAIDLVSRKLPMAGGTVLSTFIEDLRAIVAKVQAANDPAFGATGARLGEAIDSLERTSGWLLSKLKDDPEAALAGASPYLRLFALAAGGSMLAEEGHAALRLGDAAGASAANRIAIARFFAEMLAVEAPALERAIVEGAESVNAAGAVLAA